MNDYKEDYNHLINSIQPKDEEAIKTTEEEQEKPKKKKKPKYTDIFDLKQK